MRSTRVGGKPRDKGSATLHQAWIHRPDLRPRLTHRRMHPHAAREKGRRDHFWRRATVHKAVWNRRASEEAAGGPRTTGISMSSCASGATTIGARSKTRVVQV